MRAHELRPSRAVTAGLFVFMICWTGRSVTRGEPAEADARVHLNVNGVIDLVSWEGIWQAIGGNRNRLPIDRVLPLPNEAWPPPPQLDELPTPDEGGLAPPSEESDDQPDDDQPDDDQPDDDQPDDDDPLVDLDPRIRPGGDFTVEFPDLTVDRSGKTARMRVRIPDTYTTDEEYPLIVWLGGGRGTPTVSTGSKLVDKTTWVVVGLPYPKGANDSRQSNMVGNFPVIWQYHRAMLDELQKIVPNISDTRYVAGFSNGGHCIDGMLRRVSDGPGEFYSGFVLVDGGGARGTGFRARGLAGKPIFVLWGEKSPMSSLSPNVASSARRAKMLVSTEEMQGVGHSFPNAYKAKVKDWIEGHTAQ